MSFRNRMKQYNDTKRSQHSDFMLYFHFKWIRHQCKWQGRPLDTLLEYINELEYRNLKYRL